MNIIIAPYNEEWPKTFQVIKSEIIQLLSPLDIEIEHFGSTSVPGLAAKPVIDVLVGIESIHLFPNIVENMLSHGAYIHYKAFDKETPDRRLFVRLRQASSAEAIGKVLDDFDNIPHAEVNKHRIAHIHIWKKKSHEWKRHIAFRDFLIAHPEYRIEYGKLKTELGSRSWTHGMEYNDAKNDFIKRVEKLAIDWYDARRD